MGREIPRYFDSVIIEAPIQENPTDNRNINRLKVRVFTKYGNRNGSYITEEVANQLINSATTGITPVIGFFDPETQSLASHTGPSLANAYGYVENFIGWEPFQDTDGITREYAVFSVVLFTEYFDNANKIFGQNQSMELDPRSINGDWALIGDTEYFVYTTAKMLGFCVIGDHEPCFSVSAFFSKNENIENDQYQQFTALLADLREKVETTSKGGELPMNTAEDTQEVVSIEEQPAAELIENQETPTVDEEQTQNEVIENTDEFENTNEVSSNTETIIDVQQQLEMLLNEYNQLKNDYDAAQLRINELEEFQSSANTELENLRAQNQELQATVSNYEAQNAQLEKEQKDNLIKKYEKVIDEEEIAQLRDKANDYSYEELEGKLAIAFANKKLAETEAVEQVPLLEPQESQFALLMKKYRKQ